MKTIRKQDKFQDDVAYLEFQALARIRFFNTRDNLRQMAKIAQKKKIQT